MADRIKNNLRRISFYLGIWKRYSFNSFAVELNSRVTAFIFIFARLLRFVFFLVFLIILLKRTHQLGGFTVHQVVFFFLVFNFIDSLTQLLYGEVYRFRSMVVNGSFDYILLQPMNSLFRPLFGRADFLDFIILVPIISILIYVGFKLPDVSYVNVVVFILLLINSLILTTAFHIIVLAAGILTTTVDHSIMIYRDLTRMGTIPVDIYKEPIRSLLTFVIPVGIAVTFPAKAMMGLLSFKAVIVSFLIGILVFYFSLKLWHYALTKYTSASS